MAYSSSSCMKSYREPWLIGRLVRGKAYICSIYRDALITSMNNHGHESVGEIGWKLHDIEAAKATEKNKVLTSTYTPRTWGTNRVQRMIV
jgi:hypothetical protein